MAHQKGCGEKLEEAGEEKAVLKKADSAKKCLKIQLDSWPDLVILNEGVQSPVLPTALPQRV